MHCDDVYIADVCMGTSKVAYTRSCDSARSRGMSCSFLILLIARVKQLLKLFINNMLQVALTTVTFPFDELIEIATASAGIAYLIEFAVFVQMRRVRKAN